MVAGIEVAADQNRHRREGFIECIDEFLHLALAIGRRGGAFEMGGNGNEGSGLRLDHGADGEAFADTRLVAAIHEPEPFAPEAEHERSAERH
ncbi:hypothetical protein D9M69_607220 [compost metagenome]